MSRIPLLLALLVLALVPAGTAGGATAQGYIVVLEPGANAGAVAAEHAQRLGVDVGFVYRHAVRGYSAVVPAAALERLRADARVAYVERDSVVRAGGAWRRASA